MKNKQQGETLQTTEAVGLTETAKMDRELREEVMAEMEEEDQKLVKEMDEEMKNFNVLEELDGQEVWTNAFGDRFQERVCVGIRDGFCWNEGKKFKPTKKELKELWDDAMEQEFGSEAQRQADLDKEFSPEACKRMREQEIAERIAKKRGAN